MVVILAAGGGFIGQQPHWRQLYFPMLNAQQQVLDSGHKCELSHAVGGFTGQGLVPFDGVGWLNGHFTLSISRVRSQSLHADETLLSPGGSP